MSYSLKYQALGSHTLLECLLVFQVPIPLTGQSLLFLQRHDLGDHSGRQWFYSRHVFDMHALKGQFCNGEPNQSLLLLSLSHRKRPYYAQGKLRRNFAQWTILLRGLMLFVCASHTYTTLSNSLAIPIGCLKQHVISGPSEEPIF